MTTTSTHGRLAAFAAPREPFTIVTHEVPEPRPGAILVRVHMCNICGSDVHAWHGDFKTTGGLGGHLPTVLGHEMIGEVAALGAGVERDSAGRALAVGDRVTYTYFSPCGVCPSCISGRRVLCTGMRMSMLGAIDEWPYFVGGYADYFYVHPGAAVYKVPDELPDEVAAGANCALSQVMAGFSRAGLTAGETVVIQGAGGLGLYATAVARDAGAQCVIVIDGQADRLDLARRFGAHATVDLNTFDDERSRVREVMRLTGGRGGDVVMELVGVPDVVGEGIKLTAMGGRYVLIGNINAGATAALDPTRLVFANKSLIGVSLYEPATLGAALAFLERNRERLPLDALLSHKFPLESIDEAFGKAERREVLRASIEL